MFDFVNIQTNLFLVFLIFSFPCYSIFRFRFCAGYLLLQIVRNPHIILARGSESVFKLDVWIGVGSSAETAGSLRREGGTRRVHHFWESSPPQVLKVVYIDKNELPVKKLNFRITQGGRAP